jgi:hypothetical protein
MKKIASPHAHWLPACAAIVLAWPAAAAADLLVYEPFDYAPAPIAGTAASGLNLAGSYASDAVNALFELSVSAPGLSYGTLTGAPGVAGAKLTQLNGTILSGATVALAAPIEIAPGEAIFFSALFRFDDSVNNNHRAGIQLIDDVSGDAISFGESPVGVRGIRASANTTASGSTVVSGGNDQAFTNGQTLLLIGRYNNSAVPGKDRLELLGYDTAASHALPAEFLPADPNAVLYQELADADIDLARISSLRFEIRGSDNNYIDELRIGTTLADVAPVPEPQTWLMMLCGLAAVAGAARRCAKTTCKRALN